MSLRFSLSAILVLCLCCAAASVGLAGSQREKEASSQVVIKVEKSQLPPDWALRERRLLRENTRAIRAFYDHFWDERGYFKCAERWGLVDGVDDVLQGLSNLPLLYALGGEEELLDIYYEAFEGNIEQYSTKDVEYEPEGGIFYREFIGAYDWHHLAEHYAGFNQLALADPTDACYRDRALRFAGFYLNEGLPEGAEPTYDFQHHLIRSALNGSRGATFEIEDEFWGHKWQEIGKRLGREHWTNVRGDHLSLNLEATTLGTMAYVVSGKERFREWVLDYVDATCRRMRENDGIIPMNVGLSGQVGEHWDGQWWRHVWGGWRNPRGLLPALENALLLTGDGRYMEALRGQVRALLERSVEHDGKLYPPSTYGEDGWSGRQKFGRQLVRLYLTEFRQEDLQLILEEADRWNLPRQKISWRSKFFYMIHDLAWLSYIRGENPDFPRAILDADLRFIRERMRKMRRDDSEDWKRRSDRHHHLQPPATHALMYLVTGGPGPNHSKGTHPVLAEIWPFDPARGRPGLPPGVAILVRKVTKDGLVCEVVNVDQTHGRRLVLQGGAYGEHRLQEVRIRGRTHAVGGHYFEIELGPGAGAQLEVDIERFVNRPAAGLPWQ